MVTKLNSSYVAH